MASWRRTYSDGLNVRLRAPCGSSALSSAARGREAHGMADRAMGHDGVGGTSEASPRGFCIIYIRDSVEVIWGPLSAEPTKCPCNSIGQYREENDK